MTSRTHDVLVVGGGPSGAACAYWLAEAGHDVLLVEKKRFPREKTCGDGLTPRAVRQLEEMESNQVDLKIRDVAFDASLQGRRVRGTLRTLARGLDLISLTAMGPAESWVRDQETALKIINTFRYARPQSTP